MKITKKLNFLDIMIILHNNGKIDTGIFYKITNTHDYLRYDSNHPVYVKNNIPFTLAKKITIFCSNEVTESSRLAELKTWLLESKYPDQIIDRGFRNAKLQGPANKPESNNIAFVTRYATYCDSKHVIQTAEKLLNDCHSEKLVNIFQDTNVTLELKQPPNILKTLTSAKFTLQKEERLPNGLFKRNDVRWLSCQHYIQECRYFYTSNNYRWEIIQHITCSPQMQVRFFKMPILYLE